MVVVAVVAVVVALFEQAGALGQLEAVAVPEALEQEEEQVGEEARTPIDRAPVAGRVALEALAAPTPQMALTEQLLAPVASVVPQGWVE